jgi:hypothetical protein
MAFAEQDFGRFDKRGFKSPAKSDIVFVFGIKYTFTIMGQVTPIATKNQFLFIFIPFLMFF